MIRFFARICRLLPAALDRAHLQWALRELHPLHPDVPMIVRRISQIERSLR